MGPVPGPRGGHDYACKAVEIIKLDEPPNSPSPRLLSRRAPSLPFEIFVQLWDLSVALIR